MNDSIVEFNKYLEKDTEWWKEVVYTESSYMVSDEVLLSLSELEVKCMVYRTVLAEMQIGLPIAVDHSNIRKHCIEIVLDTNVELYGGPYVYIYAILARWSELHNDNSIRLDINILSKYDTLPIKNYTAEQSVAIYNQMFILPAKFLVKEIQEETNKWKVRGRKYYGPPRIATKKIDGYF